MLLYFLCDVASKTPKVLHVTNDPVKAKHWQELLTDQNKDTNIVVADATVLDTVREFLEGEHSKKESA